jgi:diaminopimelate decarboxylase
MSRRPWLKVTGLHLHIGSQITSLDPFKRAAETLVAMAEGLGDEGIRIEHLDLGGGLGLPTSRTSLSSRWKSTRPLR